MARSPYQYNGRAGRFRNPDTGRFISRAEVRDAIDRIILASQRRAQGATDDVRAGRISLDEWQRILREEIKRTQLDAEMLARGGRAQMTAADFGRVGQRVREQYRFLRDFAQQLKDGAIRTDGTAINRAKMYSAASRAAFHESERDVMQAAGYTHERSMLAIAEHCDVCVREAARGSVPIGTLIPIGDRSCLSNCRCSIAYA
jgi:hypothetical protein